MYMCMLQFQLFRQPVHECRGDCVVVGLFFFFSILFTGLFCNKHTRETWCKRGGNCEPSGASEVFVNSFIRSHSRTRAVLISELTALIHRESTKKMSQKTRGIFQVILKSMFDGAKPKMKPKFMGEDYFGTKYYEEPPESSGRKTRGRYFEPVTKDNFEQEMPAEWEAWLRYRRSVPPTKEEIAANYQLIITKRENAAKLEIEYSAKRDKVALPVRGEQHSSSAFPVYKEYEDFGRTKDPDDSKK